MPTRTYITSREPLGLSTSGTTLPHGIRTLSQALLHSRDVRVELHLVLGREGRAEIRLLRHCQLLHRVTLGAVLLTERLECRRVMLLARSAQRLVLRLELFAKRLRLRRKLLANCFEIRFLGVAERNAAQERTAQSGAAGPAEGTNLATFTVGVRTRGLALLGDSGGRATNHEQSSNCRTNIFHGKPLPEGSNELPYR